MARSLPVLALTAALLGGAATEIGSAAELPFMSTPPVPAAKCRAIAELRPGCPAEIPEVPRWGAAARRLPESGFAIWDIARGVADAAKPEDGRPPDAVHVTLIAGRVEASMGGFDFPRSGRPRPVRNGLLRQPRRRAVFLGHRTWSDRDGVLVLAPPNPNGGQVGDHLLFRWHQGGRDFVLSLHGWEPFTEAARALRRLVASLPAASPRSRSSATSLAPGAAGPRFTRTQPSRNRARV